MPNTITNTRIVTSNQLIVQQILLVSDGSEETDLVVYDSSAVATALGKSDPLNSRLMRCMITGINAATVATLTFEYDASTDVIALPIDIGAAASSTRNYDFDFREHGGIVNVAGAGKTGDILLTTTALDSGDTLLMFLYVRPY